ncbi:MAG TPA: hypothetical protein DEF34_05335 [Desulfotomaculum sp.]|nr:MAG: hypothetical protein VR67_03010 [Peptococcaceae bacterium BRH_c8a]KJS71545.1 MAG: hypothetical protein JL56_14285 [Desulfotomaculum sp. BICA1-6]HBX23041.1 hypothetical protein [Desulfotomaculum sp.]
MLIPPELFFPPGVRVVITMNNGQVFSGEMIGMETSFILPDGSVISGIAEPVKKLLMVRLLEPSAPYVASQIVRLDIDSILAIG